MNVADTTMACIGARLERSVDEIFAACDARLRDTRRVSLVVAIVDLDSGWMSMASIGAIRAVLLTRNTDFRLDCTREAVGGDHSRLKSATKTLTSGDVLALFSDGLNASFPLRDALTNAAQDGDNLAGDILADWSPVDADAAILIYRHKAAEFLER